MGAAASMNMEALNALKEASAVSDVADPRAEVVRLRKLIASSGAGSFAQFKDEAGKPPSARVHETGSCGAGWPPSVPQISPLARMFPRSISV